MKIKITLLFITFLVLMLAVTAQYSIKSDMTKISPNLKNISEDNVKVWVLFTDKGNLSKSQIDAFFKKNSDYISERSKERREKKSISEYSSYDLPLNKDYITVLENSGFTISNQSKWLNGVTLYTDRKGIELLSSFSFVKNIRPVSISKIEADLKDVKKIPLKSTKADSTENVYYYGVNCSTQIYQSKVYKLHNMGYTGRGVLIALFDTGLMMTREMDKVDATVTPPETTWLAPIPVHTALKDINILCSYDFVNNYNFAGITEGGIVDEVTQLDHGTKMLGLLGGYQSGELISPAFGADYIIAKTEIVDTEIISEEDNWVRAAEWADSLGADIISSSLGYKDWNPYSMLTGDSALISKAANIAYANGILVVNSIGNVPSDMDRADTMIAAPADAFGVLSVGGVDDNGLYATVSATGPTYDVLMDSTGANIRYKPEICGLAEWPYTLRSDDSTAFTYVLGTSGASALIAGGCALILQAHPDWSPDSVKSALMHTSYAPFLAVEPETTYYEVPNYIVGYGIADFYSAVMYADTDEVITIEENSLTAPYPNPYSASKGNIVIPFKLKRTISNLMLFIYTLDGRLVYCDEMQNVLPGVYDKKDNAFVWNGKPAINSDLYSENAYVRVNSEESVKPGVYIVMLQTGFNKSIKKISIIP